MQYEDLENDKLPIEVWSNMFRLLELEDVPLVQEVLTWDSFYLHWSVLCRKYSQSDRLEHVKSGKFISIAKNYKKNEDAKAGTLMTTLWCMPDEFLDIIIKIKS